MHHFGDLLFRCLSYVHVRSVCEMVPVCVVCSLPLWGKEGSEDRQRNRPMDVITTSPALVLGEGVGK